MSAVALAPEPVVVPRGSLTLRTAFGMNFSMRSNTAWLDADNIVYVAGGFIVRLNVKTRAQTFSVLDDGYGAPACDGGPTAMTLSTSKRYLAMAMAGKTGAYISIYATRTMARRKTIKLSLGEGAPGMTGNSISALVFSSDDAWVAALGVAPSWSLGVFNVERGRLCALVECADDAPLAGALPLTDGDKGDGLGGAQLPFEVAGVAFSPSDPDRLVAWGSAGYVRFFTVTDKPPAPFDQLPINSDGGSPMPETPNAGGSALSAHEAGAKRRKEKLEYEVAALTAAAQAVALSHSMLPSPSSPIFLAYVSALHELHEVQAAKYHVTTKAGHKRHLGSSRLRAATLDEPGIGVVDLDVASSMTSPVYDAETAARIGEDFENLGSEAVDDVVAPFVDEDVDNLINAPATVANAFVETSILGSDLSGLSPVEAAVVNAAVQAARASTTPALSWLSFTAGTWVTPSGPINVPVDSAATALWTPESSADVCTLATAAGDVLCFKAGVFLSALPMAPRDGHAILTLAPFSRGFIAGSAGGSIRVFELMDPEIHAAELDDLKFSAHGAFTAGGSALDKVGTAATGIKQRAGAKRRMSARSRVLKARNASAISNATDLVDEHPEEDDAHPETGLGIIDEPSFVLGPLGVGAYFAVTRTLEVEQVIVAASPEPSVTFITIRPEEKAALIVVAGTQCMLLDLENLNVTEGNRALSELTALSSHAAAPNAFCGPGSALNSCAIIAMDVAARKPLIVTAGVDKVIRVWNWVERSCELARFFDEMPVTVAMSPSGFHVVIAFGNNFSLFSVLANGLRKISTYQVRGVTRAKFSRGGAFFAAAAGSHVNIVSTLTGIILFSLRGHTDAVTSLVWAYNDATLVSTGLDGAIFEWDVREGKRGREYLHRGLRIFAASYSKDNRSVMIVGDVTTQAGANPAFAAPDGTSSSTIPHALPHIHPSVSLAVLREIDLDTGVVVKDWVFDSGITHAGLALTTQLSPLMMFSCEGKLPGVPTITTGTIAIVDPLAMAPPPPRGPAGLAGVTSAIVANAAVSAWAAASAPGGGALWSFEMPLASAPYPGAGAAASAAIAAAQGRGVEWTPELGIALPIPFDPPAAARFSCAGTGAHSLILSSDEMFLFVAGINGTIFVYDVRDAEGLAPISDAPSKIPWSDEIQLTRADLAERQNSLKFLREQLGEVQANAEYKSITRENGASLQCDPTPSLRAVQQLTPPHPPFPFPQHTKTSFTDSS